MYPLRLYIDQAQNAGFELGPLIEINFVVYNLIVSMSDKFIDKAVMLIKEQIDHPHYIRDKLT